MLVSRTSSAKAGSLERLEISGMECACSCKLAMQFVNRNDNNSANKSVLNDIDLLQKLIAVIYIPEGFES